MAEDRALGRTLRGVQLPLAASGQEGLLDCGTWEGEKEVSLSACPGPRGQGLVSMERLVLAWNDMSFEIAKSLPLPALAVC